MMFPLVGKVIIVSLTTKNEELGAKGVNKERQEPARLFCLLLCCTRVFPLTITGFREIMIETTKYQRVTGT